MKAVAAALALALTASHAGFVVVAGTPPKPEIVDARGRVQRVIDAASYSQSLKALLSPDGSMIAWADGAGVEVEHLDGGGRRLLIPTQAGCTVVCVGPTFAWSSDGTSLLVGRGGNESTELFRVNVATGKASRIAPVRRFTEYSVIGWSPATDAIAYVRSSGDAGTASCCQLLLVVAKPDGSHPRVLYRAADAIHDGPAASWSPDGHSIAFTTDGMDLRDPRFAVVDVATGRMHTIGTVSPYTAAPVWSPDSKRLAVGTPGGDVVTLSPDGKNVRDLRTQGVPYSWTRTTGLTIVDQQSYRNVYRSDGSRPGRLLFRFPATIDWIEPRP